MPNVFFCEALKLHNDSGDGHGIYANGVLPSEFASEKLDGRVSQHDSLCEFDGGSRIEACAAFAGQCLMYANGAAVCRS